MERFTFFDGGKWRLNIGSTEYSGKIADRLAAYEDLGREPAEIKKELDSSAFSKNELVEMLESLVNSSSSGDRHTAASLGYGLERLVYDEAFQVRCECARHGAGVGILVKDPEPAVREELAKCGHALETLMHDENAFVRSAVANQGYKLNELIKDESSLVRWNVAQQEYGWDVLIKDQANSVVREVKSMLKDKGQSLEEWIRQNPEKCALPENRKKGLDAAIVEADRMRDQQAGPGGRLLGRVDKERI